MTTQYAYNGDGVRVAKTVGDVATDYLVDLVSTLPVVISDTEAIYLYGLDIIAQHQAGARMYYVHDGLGSVRQLTDEQGQIAETYAYDPFGVPLEGDSVYNPYRFTGEAWDPEAELLYLRARYYQPATGRFVTRDPWPADPLQPRTLNRYVYVQNNSVNYADPTGFQGRYEPYEAYQQSSRLISDWFWQRGEIRQEFGPDEPLTQDVRYSRGVNEFKRLWAQEGEHEVPWWWTGHSIDVREGPLPLRLYWGAVAYSEANMRRELCHIGLGSRTPQGQFDPLDATLGTLDEISVRLEGTHRLRFEVFNQMGWASATRVPGTDFHFLDDVHRGESWGWGGTIYQLFHWFEPAEDYPDLKIRPDSHLLSRLWADRW